MAGSWTYLASGSHAGAIPYTLSACWDPQSPALDLTGGVGTPAYLASRGSRVLYLGFPLPLGLAALRRVLEVRLVLVIVVIVVLVLVILVVILPRASAQLLVPRNKCVCGCWMTSCFGSALLMRTVLVRCDRGHGRVLHPPLCPIYAPHARVTRARDADSLALCTLDSLPTNPSLSTFLIHLNKELVCRIIFTACSPLLLCGTADPSSLPPPPP